MERTGSSTPGSVRCGRCDQQAWTVSAGAVPTALAGAVTDWQSLVAEVVARPGGADLIAARPAPDIWSAVEYAGHVRDFLAVTTRHVRHLESPNQGRLEPWDPRALVESGHYRDLWPAAVSADLVLAGRELADLLADAGRDRVGVPVESSSSAAAVEARGRLALHETRHHLDDALLGLAAMAG